VLVHNSSIPVQTMGLMDFQFRAPEVATVVRWILRVVLVCFLAWLVKGRGGEEPEEEPDEAEEKQRTSRPQGQQRQQNNGRDNYRDNYARQPRTGGRDPYAPRESQMRQRRPDGNGAMDFDAVINKMSKPKQMWQVSKDAVSDGRKPLQLTRRSDSVDLDTSAAETKDGEPRARKSEDASTLLKKVQLHAHERPVTWITWNRDGNLLFSCGKDKKVCVWSFPDGECLGTYEGHQGAVWACSVTADSSWLVSGGADQNVIVWEASSSRELARVELPGVCRFVEWASSGDGKSERFVTVHNKFGSNPPAITVWKFDGEVIEQQLRFMKLPGAALQVRWGLDDKLLASSHENGELIFWQADTGEEVRRLQAHPAVLSKFEFSSDRLLCATASTDKKARVWDLGEEGSDPKMLFEVETDRPLNAVALGPLKRAQAIGPESERPTCCSLLAAGGQDIRDVALTKASDGEFDVNFYKVGATTLEAKGSKSGHFGPVHTLAFTADGKAMASGSEDGCIRLHLFDESALK